MKNDPTWKKFIFMTLVGDTMADPRKPIRAWPAFATTVARTAEDGMQARRVLLVVFALAVVYCGGSTHTPVTETFSSTIRDAPNVDGQRHDISVDEAGALAATLAWVPQQSSQPAGQAVLAMTLRDRAGTVVFDTYGTPTSNPTIASAPVRKEVYTLTVRPQFRERIGFYCLCDVAYSVVVVHP